MLGRWTACAFAALVTISAAAAGHAAAAETASTRTAVRSGNHPDFGRIVVDTTGQPRYQVSQDGDHVVLRFDDGVLLGSPPALPRNVTAMKTNGSVAELTLARGAVLHTMRLGGRIVLDALDASDKASSTPPVAPPPLSRPSPTAIVTGGSLAKPVSAKSVSAKPELSASPQIRSDPPAMTTPAVVAPPDPGGHPLPGLSAERVAVDAQPLPPQPLPPLPSQPLAASLVVAAGRPMPSEETRPAAPVADVLPADAGPIGLRARRVKLPKDMDGSAFLVPFASTTAAAAFLTAHATHIAFDERRPVDMAGLRDDPVFGATTVELLPGGTLFRVPLPPGRFVALTQMPQGWRIAVLPVAPALHPIVAAFADGRLNLAADQPGSVISLADPDTGATLLAGTQHRPGQGILAYRRSPEFIMRPTSHGVVVEAISDAITLRPTPTGFTLAGRPTGLILPPNINLTDLLTEAASLTGQLDLPIMPTDALLRRARRMLAEAAAKPPLARGPYRRAAAESLLALGFFAEAESLLHMVTEQDPKEGASAETQTLTAVAALLAGRIDEAAALSDRALDGTDEIAFWRAARLAMRDEGSPAAAAVFSKTAPLILEYPAPIRQRVLPLVIETMIQGGEIAPAARLLNEFKNTPKLAYARALMRQAEGNTADALNMLDALATGHDQFDRARAAVRAVELRLASRTIDKTAAADGLDKLLYAWRGDGRELALRQRIAELRGQSGAWRAALATLRQAETDFPEQAAPIRERLKDIFADMIRDEGTRKIPAIEFVSMVDENADLMPANGGEEPIEQALADRLSALDLPGRAKPVLEKLLRSARSDIAKAQFGASLAALESREGNDAAARAVLTASDGRLLPPDLAEQRAILLAGSVARLGNPAEAAELLTPFRSNLAMETRARIQEAATDWTEAAKTRVDLVALTVAESGPLDESGAQAVLRLTTATARAGNDAGLAELLVKFGGRIGAGPAGDLFRVLTAEPIRTSADIGRSQRETRLAATLPGGLKALQAGVSAR